MHRERKDKHFIHKPSYPGGREAMKAFISKNLRYPKEALAAKVEGTVSIKYTIDHKGNVTEARVVSGLGHGCDEEAMRLARLLKFQVPKTPKKRKVLFHKDLHVHFRLPKQPVQAKTTYQYVTPASKTTVQEPSQSRKGGYNYTITITKKD